MVDKWYLFNRDVYCGILMRDEETKEFSFKKDNEEELVEQAIKNKLI